MKTLAKPVSVFLVDDDTMMLSALKNSLNRKLKSKIEINSFGTGEECLTKLNEDNPDVIIVDYYLNSENEQAMDGLSLLKKIKALNKSAHVIMLSGQNKLEVVADSFRNGAFEYVIKNESFFVRIENMVKNIVSSITIDRAKNKYEKWNYILGGGILVFIVLDLLYYLHHS